MSDNIKKKIIDTSTIGEWLLIAVLLAVYASREWIKFDAWSQIVVAVILIVPLVYLKVRKLGFQKIGLSTVNIRKSLLAGLILGLILVLISILIFYQSLAGFYLSPELKQGGWWFILASFFGGLILTALPEEVMFRGFLQSRLEGVTARPAVFIQAVIFTALHTRYYLGGFWYISLFVLIFAITAGFLTQRTRNLSGAILMHGMVDAFGSALFYVYPVVRS